ncbi:MAG: hypothetical protein M3065_18115, partial [Actinomycetota bacterium]|nr:hypothetical protein [Actinomycetota bacterium]
MNQPHQLSAAGRPALRAVLAALALGMVLAGCGSSKPTAAQPAGSRVGAASTQTTSRASVQ